MTYFIKHFHASGLVRDMRIKIPHYCEWPGPSASSNRGKDAIGFIQCDILDTKIHLKLKRKKLKFKNLFITDI